MRATGSVSRAAVAAALLMAAATAASGDGVQGKLVRRDTGGTIEGEITWFAGAREYGVTRGAEFSTRVPEAQVADVIVPKPAQLDQLAAMVKAGRHAEAAAPLADIVKRYEMLKWDVPAARWLAEAYLNLNRLREAEEMCEKVFRASPDARSSGELMRVYWDVLERGKKDAKLKAALEEAARTGGRDVAAVAQLKRGDLERTGGDLKKALLDGYLRTVLMFGDVPAVQPEALLKASECFQQLGQAPYAERMRKQLLESYPQSPEAQKVRSGGA